MTEDEMAGWHAWRKYSDKGGKAPLFPHCSMTVKPTVRDQLCSFHPMLSWFSLDAGAVLSLAQTHRGRPQTTSTRLYAGGELQGSPVWHAEP